MFTVGPDTVAASHTQETMTDEKMNVTKQVSCYTSRFYITLDMAT